MKDENFSQHCALWNQPYSHLVEMDILLPDSLEMDLLIEDLMIKLECKFTWLGMVISLLKDAKVEITFRAPYLPLPFLPRSIMFCDPGNHF